MLAVQVLMQPLLRAAHQSGVGIAVRPQRPRGTTRMSGPSTRMLLCLSLTLRLQPSIGVRAHLGFL